MATGGVFSAADWLSVERFPSSFACVEPLGHYLGLNVSPPFDGCFPGAAVFSPSHPNTAYKSAAWQQIKKKNTKKTNASAKGGRFSLGKKKKKKNNNQSN